MDLATKEGAEHFAEAMMRGAQDFFNERGWHPLVSYVLATKTVSPEQPIPAGEVGVLLLVAEKVSDALDRDGFAAMTRAIVEQGCAVGVLTMMEAWHVQIDQARHDYAEEVNRVRAMKSIEGYPGRREAIMVSLEHIRANAQWRGDILRDGSSACVARFERLPEMLQKGRFADLLTKERFQ